jgi:hypothetical protein
MWYSRAYDTPEDEEEARRHAQRVRQAKALARAKALDPDLDFALTDFNEDEKEDPEACTP